MSTYSVNDLANHFGVPVTDTQEYPHPQLEFQVWKVMPELEIKKSTIKVSVYRKDGTLMSSLGEAKQVAQFVAQYDSLTNALGSLDHRNVPPEIQRKIDYIEKKNRKNIRFLRLTGWVGYVETSGVFWDWSN